MVELKWFEIFPPAGIQLADVTAVLRPIAGRTRRGMLRITPVVVFELRAQKDRVRWLAGMEPSLAPRLPEQMSAQMTGLGIAPYERVDRPVPSLGKNIRVEGLSYPLRLDTSPAVCAALMQIADTLGKRESVVVQWVIGPSSSRHAPPNSFTVTEALGFRAPTKPDSNEQRAWRSKAEEPLFAVRGRLGAQAATVPRAANLLKALLGALGLANGPRVRLVAGRASSTAARRLDQVLGSTPQTWSGILNAAELAVVLAWPLEGVTVPGMVGPTLGRAPAELLTPPDAPPAEGRVLGASLHPADNGSFVTMPVQSSLHHVHLIGPTGSGKSSELAQLVLADVAAGHGVLVVEPKGDLVADLLARIPKHRHDDIVLIEPSDQGPVVGLNPLAGPTSEAERRADELLHLFKELFGTAIGPRSSDVLLHALITVARLPGGTLTDLPVLLTNAKFRRQMLAKVSDQLVLAPFWAWYDNLSEPERGQVVAPVMNKLRVFLSRAALRRLLGQAAPRFSLDELFTKNRIVLVNLNKGLIGPETARLLGSLLLTSLWQAIQRRAVMPTRQRQPVMAVIDEWQDYTAALDFGDVLAQARGLGVSFTVAHQHLGQLSTTLRAAVLANARSRIAFHPAHDDARALAAVLGGGITPEDLERLGAYQVVARLLVNAALSPPFGLRTMPLPAAGNDPRAVGTASRNRYGTDGATVDESLNKRWQGEDGTATGPIGVRRRSS